MSTYTGKFYCLNCQRIFQTEVPKGTTLDNYINEVTCPNCGTQEIKVAISQD